MMFKPMLSVIKTKSCIYISAESYTNLEGYLFDGLQGEKTFKQGWLKLSSVPTKIERIIPASRKRSHWELKEGYNPSDSFPKVIDISEDITDEDSEYYNVSGLYNSVYIQVDQSLEQVTFEINVIEEIDGEFSFSKKDFEPKYNLLDQLNTHPALLETKPCKLSSADSYKIIRKYIKENINPKVSTITSDYDFCMSVTKNIKHEPEAYRYNVGTLKKPKYDTRYRSSRPIEVYRSAPCLLRNGVYSGYPETIQFSGENYEDMQLNIDTYLANLILEINRPLQDCPHCQGRGVIQYES